MSSPPLYTLRDRDLLRAIMQNPGRGQKYGIRELAKTARCHASTIGHLLSGRQESCSPELAHRITKALGVALLVLFAPSASPDEDESALAESMCAA